MKLFDKVLNSKFNNNMTEKHIGNQYQPRQGRASSFKDDEPVLSNNNNKPITTNSTPITIKPISDVEGLQHAYSRENGVFINNHTMYVAGSRDTQDWYDNFTKLPTNTTYKALKYINADKALKQNDELYPDNKITSLVGHSQAGSVVLEMQKQYPDRNFKTTTYGAPLLSMTTPDNINNKRYRNYDDPVSMFDRGATMNVKNPLTIQNYLNIKSPSNIAEVATKMLNNHAYDNFTDNQIDNTSQDMFVYKTDE